VKRDTFANLYNLVIKVA